MQAEGVEPTMSFYRASFTDWCSQPTIYVACVLAIQLSKIKKEQFFNPALNKNNELFSILAGNFPNSG
jgi:hypothetical protein